MQHHPSLSAIIDAYDALILDLWGVVHDGTHLYPGVRECLAQLRAAEKRVVLLSNAPRRAANVISVLERLGIERALYEQIITSGDATYQWLATQAQPLNYHFIGPERDLGLAEGLPHRRVLEVEEADIILNIGFEYDTQTYAELAPRIVAAARRNLHMLCVNPDMEVVKLSGERFLCAGYSAREYEKLGGKVTYFGKPHKLVYEMALAQLSPIPKNRILAVGDTLATDIAGARRMGVASALVTGGVLRELLAASPSPTEALHAICMEQGIFPEYSIPALVW